MIDILEEYYALNFSTLVKKLSRRAGTPEGAEDVVQESFTRAIRSLHRYNPKKSFEAWFITIMNNALRDYQRDERNYGMGMEFKEELFEPVEMDLSDNVVAQRIDGEIAKKTRPTRDILFLYYVRGLKPGEICKMLDVQNKNVRMTVLRFKHLMIEMYSDII